MDAKEGAFIIYLEGGMMILRGGGMTFSVRFVLQIHNPWMK